ncbi:MAG TPA: DsrE family protein [Phycisphaerales bacterium]|nr:DsrE family protein [Phycisphaerales bacterium]
MERRRSNLKAWSVVTVCAVLGLALGAAVSARPPGQPTRLAVVWSSADPEVAHRVCLMYTHASRKSSWFDETHLIIWGPSARLLAADKDIQAKVKEMMADGVVVRACQACADSYGVTEALRAQGIEVKYMGKPLSDILHEGWKVLTF